MTVLSVSFTKVYAERSKSLEGSVKINTNVTITSVEKFELSLSTVKQPAARFGFEFKVGYDPKIGEIGILGEVVYLDTDKAINALVEGWKKTKKVVDQKVVVTIINRILSKSHVEALILSKELNLPAPVQLPKVTSNVTK